MEDYNILNTLHSMKEQIYLDFNTMNSLNNYLDSILLSNQNKKFSKTISLLNEDSQKKAEEFQKENQILQNRIKKLEEIIQNNKIENQNLLKIVINKTSSNHLFFFSNSNNIQEIFISFRPSRNNFFPQFRIEFSSINFFLCEIKNIRHNIFFIFEIFFIP